MKQDRVVDFFIRRWNTIIDTLEFNSEWELPIIETSLSKMSGNKYTTYLDGAVYSKEIVELEAGKIFKTMSDHGRRAIIITTRLGPVIVYEHNGITFACSNRLRNIELLPFFFIFTDDVELAKVIGGTVGVQRGIYGLINSEYQDIGKIIDIIYKLLMNK